MRISDWSSDVCSSDLQLDQPQPVESGQQQGHLRHIEPELAADRRHLPVVAQQMEDQQQARIGGERFLLHGFEMFALGAGAARHAHQFEQVDIQQPADALQARQVDRSEEHTSELQSLMRNSYAVLCLKKKKTKEKNMTTRES